MMEMTGASTICGGQCILSPWSPWSVFKHVPLMVSCCLSKEISLFLPFSFQFLSSFPQDEPRAQCQVNRVLVRGGVGSGELVGMVPWEAAERTFFSPALD